MTEEPKRRQLSPEAGQFTAAAARFLGTARVVRRKR